MPWRLQVRRPGTSKWTDSTVSVPDIPSPTGNGCMIGQTAHILVVVTHSWGGKRTLDEPFFATKSFVFGGVQLALSQPFTTCLLNPISRHPWLSLSLWTRFCFLSFCWILLSLSIDAWRSSNSTHILELGWNHQLYNCIVHTVIMHQVVVDIFINMPNDLTLKSLFDVLFIYILHQPLRVASLADLQGAVMELSSLADRLINCLVKTSRDLPAIMCVCVFVYKCLQTFQDK